VSFTAWRRQTARCFGITHSRISKVQSWRLSGDYRPHNFSHWEAYVLLPSAASEAMVNKVRLSSNYYSTSDETKREQRRDNRQRSPSAEHVGPLSHAPDRTTTVTCVEPVHPCIRCRCNAHARLRRHERGAWSRVVVRVTRERLALRQSEPKNT
jgi:hypothetical protein